MEFSEVISRALRIRSHYADYEERLYGRSWTTEELFIGMIGDIGDLAKLVQAHEGVRAIDESESLLRRELADVLWSVIVLADRCGVDLEAAFKEDMDNLEGALVAHEGESE
jgi:NTP pyrophosphatase (non-canonical NTP hydrolase)